MAIPRGRKNISLSRNPSPFVLGENLKLSLGAHEVSGVFAETLQAVITWSMSAPASEATRTVSAASQGRLQLSKGQAVLRPSELTFVSLKL